MSEHKILIVDDEEEIREVMVMMIDNIGHYNIIEASSGNNAIQTLENDLEIKLIFCDYRMNDGNGGDVYQWVAKNRPQVPFILVSTAEPRDIDTLKKLFDNNPLNDHIVKPFDDDMLRKSIERVFLKPEDKKKRANLNDRISFCLIPILDFLKYNPACKVFIKINEDKFVKIREDNDLSVDLIRKYHEKGMNDIYILKADYEVLLFDRLKEVNSTNEYANSIQFTREVIRNLGVQAVTVEQIDKVLSLVEEEITSHPELMKFLEKFKSKRNYITDHSFLTAYLSCAFAKEMTWNSPTIWKKFIFAALFKDISLETEDQAKVMDIKSKEFFQFDFDTQTLIKNHMYISAQYFDKLQSISEDVRNMLLTHHEKPDGTGFPRGLDANHVAPMEALFILSVNIAHELLIGSLDYDHLGNWLKTNEDKWTHGNYKRSFSAVHKVIYQKV